MTVRPIQRALLSVSNKEGIEALARFLSSRGIEILSTGGTAQMIRSGGTSVRDVSDYTGSPEVMEGRVKTLHPRIHGGILARRVPEHLKDLEGLGGAPIDLVVVNLYPFEETVARSGSTVADAIENIDIGGPSMIRSAAKNFDSVAVVVDPSDYEALMKEIEETGGTSLDSRKMFSGKAFRRTAQYDGAIARYLSGIGQEGGGLFEREDPLPDFLPLFFQKKQPLRYGENPQQVAAFYTDSDAYLGGLVQHQGKELSFNNLMDLGGAWSLVSELPRPACAVIKHTNPCGVGLGDGPTAAFNRARETDPLSAFGGIVAFNTPCDVAAAQELSEMFLEIVVAPAFEEAALKTFARKKNLRVITLKDQDPFPGFDFKRVGGGLLVQTPDLPRKELRQVVTKRKPTDAEMRGMELMWTVCKFVKSNAIVIGDDTGTVGVGAGQMSRVDSVKIAKMKSYRDPQGCVAASDAFFPFPDGIEELAAAGVTAVIQPGGSIRDPLVVETADKLDLAMVLTETRHFRHG